MSLGHGDYGLVLCETVYCLLSVFRHYVIIVIIKNFNSFFQMCVNGFNILDPEMLSVGTGIYLGCSVIDHSCDPNAVAVFEGVTIHIRAVKDMPVLDWGKVYLYIIPASIFRY